MLVERLSAAVVESFVGYVLLGVTGLLLLRANLPAAASSLRGGEPLSPAVLAAAAGAVSYVLSFGLWLVVLAKVRLSIAYPLAVGATRPRLPWSLAASG